MVSNEMIVRMIEKAEIYAYESKYNDDFRSSEFYEAVSDALNWVLNSNGDTFFANEDKWFTS